MGKYEGKKHYLLNIISRIVFIYYSSDIWPLEKTTLWVDFAKHHEKRTSSWSKILSHWPERHQRDQSQNIHSTEGSFTRGCRAGWYTYRTMPIAAAKDTISHPGTGNHTYGRPEIGEKCKSGFKIAGSWT